MERLHIISRTMRPDFYPPRFLVPDDKVDWNIPFSVYNSQQYTGLRVWEDSQAEGKRYYKNLPREHSSVTVLLLVKANYRDYRTLPGGVRYILRKIVHDNSRCKFPVGEFFDT